MKTVGVTCYALPQNDTDYQLSYQVWQDGKLLLEDGKILQSKVLSLSPGQTLLIQAFNKTTGDNHEQKSKDNGGTQSSTNPPAKS